MHRSLPIAGSVIAALFVALLAVGVAAQPQPTSPSDAVSRAYLHGYNLPSSGVALEGYCPVAYFVAGKPVRGSADFAVVHDDVTYYFVNADAKRLFEKNPEKYLPAYGGWCAYGIALGDKFPVDPTRFKIVDGRLMLFLRNRNIDTLPLWLDGGEAALAAKADAHWQKMTQ